MKNVFHFVRWMMLTSGIVPNLCAAAAEAVVQLPANSKHPSKLSGACCLDADRGEKESGTGRPKTSKWS